MMDGRQSLINAIITLVVVAILALVASVFKFRAGHGLLGEARPNVVTQQSIAQPEAEILNASPVREDLPTVREPGSYEILPDCQCILDAENTGSSFRVFHGGREFVLHLYYAEAPWVRGSAPDQGAYPGGVLPSLAGDPLFKASDDAWEFSLSFIRDRPFRVFTRWERAGEEDHIYGFVVVHAAGKGRFLSELLVSNGYASIMDRSVALPDGQTQSKDYLEHLGRLSTAARTHSQGLWGMLQPAVNSAVQAGAYVPAG